MFGRMTVIVRQYETGLKFLNGRFIGLVGPGRFGLWRLPWRTEEIQRVDLRRTELQTASQELLTADGLTVRVTLAADFRVADPVRATQSVASFATSLYTTLQLALREAVQGRALDALLAERSLLGSELLERTRAEAEEFGLELIRVGVKDIVLPGDVKRMLSQEAEALRAGRAALVAAREEIAATRARANTARMLRDNPALLRLREMEALERVGAGMGNTVVLAVPPSQATEAAIHAREG